MQESAAIPSQFQASSAVAAEQLGHAMARPIDIATDTDVSYSARPVTQRERIFTVDVVRGFALMGILVMNIAAFSGPLEMYINPLMVGNHRTFNLIAWSIRWILFEGKMRAAFSMLFGAGVVLLTERAELRGSRNVADVFLRRNMWLMLFGIIHFYFVWIGDILFFYGLTALLFLYPCRKVRSRNLLIAGVLVLAIGMGSDAFQSVNSIRERNRGLEAQALSNAGKKLTQSQQDDLKKWNETLEKRKKEHDSDLKAMRGSYLDALKYHGEWGPRIQATSYYMFGFADLLGMMLIGMGLYRAGFLTGALSYRAYGWTIAIGYLLSLPINGIQTWGLIRDNFQPESAWWVLYQMGRLTGAVANIAVVVLVVKAGLAPWLTKRVAAVGQTAISNYLFTSISCTLLFNGFGFGLYGKLEYYQLYAVVACVWALNLIISPLWLRRFRFGPMEWVWRSLTYWKPQPMRRCVDEEQVLAA